MGRLLAALRRMLPDGEDRAPRDTPATWEALARDGRSAVCDEVIRMHCEDLGADFFAQLGPSDLLFADNSHRSFPSSDVTVFFLEIVPALPAGLVYGIHDIFLPQDYPRDWAGRMYNEQYLL